MAQAAFEAFAKAAGRRWFMEHTRKAWRPEDFAELSRLRREERRLFQVWVAAVREETWQRILKTPFGEIPGGCYYDDEGNLYV